MSINGNTTILANFLLYNDRYAYTDATMNRGRIVKLNNNQNVKLEPAVRLK
jgi:hypothetical protein